MTYNMRNSSLKGFLKKSPMQHKRSQKIELPPKGSKKYAWVPVSHEHTLADGSVITNKGNTHETRVIKGEKKQDIKLNNK
tara:strand:+ start:448 stop:687 length:240 start_codon:yes stop_codon:yes gene_type:complete